MADASREIRAKYIADITQLEKASKRASDVVVANVEKANQAQQAFANTTAATVNRAAQAHTKVVGKFATSFSAIGSVLGQAGGEVAAFAGRLGQAVFAATEAFFAGGGFVAAIVGAGAALLLLKPRLEAAGQAMEDFGAQVDRSILRIVDPEFARKLDLFLDKLKRIADGVDESLGKKAEDLVKDYVKALERALKESHRLGDETIYFKTQLELATKTSRELFDLALQAQGETASAIGDQYAAIAGAARSAQAALDLQKVNAGFAQFEQELRKVQITEELFGGTQQTLAAQVSLFEKTIVEATSSLEQLKNKVPSEEFDKAAKSIDELKNRLVELKIIQAQAASSGAVQDIEDQTLAVYDLKQAWDDAKFATVQYFTDAQAVAARIIDTIGAVFNSVTNGAAQSIATLLIYGGSVADILTNVFAGAAQALLKLAIDSFIGILIMTYQLIITKSIEAYSSIPFVGLALGLAAGAAAIAAARSQSSKARSQAKVPAFAEGGIVSRPTLALIGEAGPEAVIPKQKLDLLLSNASGLGNGGGATVVLNVDGKRLGQVMIERMPALLKRKGLRVAT